MQSPQSEVDQKLEARLLNSREVAAVIGCSVRHLSELEKDRFVPPPIWIGRLKRWRKGTILRWLNQGCPPMHKLQEDY